MKKIFAVLAGTILLLLTACGQGQSSDGSLSESPSEKEQTSVSVPAPAQTDSPDQSSRKEKAEPLNLDTSIEETVLVDEGDVKITATGLQYETYEINLSLTIENNTDRRLSFYAGTMGYSCNSVNGYMVDDGYLNVDVAPGKKTNKNVSFNVDELTLLGITGIADIELGFQVSDDHYNDYLETGPRQVKTTLADSYDYETDTYRQAITDSSLANQIGYTVEYDSDEVSFDQKGIRVLSQTLITNADGEQVLLVEVENTSEKMIYASASHVALNGLTVESGAWSTDLVGIGKRRILSMPLSSMLDSSCQELLGLSEIGSVSYSLEIRDIGENTLAGPAILTFSVPGKAASYDNSGEALYQENNIRIVSRGLMPDPFEFSDDIHLLLLVENGSPDALSFDVDYNSVSLNGYMTDFICYNREVAPGGGAVLDVQLLERSLEENGITCLEDITEAELSLKIRNDRYKTIAEPVVTVHIP